MEERKEMNGLQVMGYGVGSLGKDFALGVMSSYLLLFYTDVFGIPAAAAGLIFLITKIWDAINDPMMGALADRSPVTRWGKYRPYILFTSIPLAILCFMCFLTPDLSMGGKIAYAAITYTLTGMVFTAYDVPLWAMVTSLTNNQNTRNKLIGAARTFTSIGILLASAVAYNIIHVLGGGSEVANLRVGYPRFMAIVGVVSVVFAVITFISTKEVNVPVVEKQEMNIVKMLKQVMCKPLVMVLLAMVCCAFCMLLPGTIGTYYMIYYLGRPDLIPVYMIISMGIGVFASMASPFLLKKLSIKQLSVVGFGMHIVAGVIIFFVGNGNLAILFSCFAVVGLATGLLMVTITSMLAETAQYIGKAKGTRADGICFSMNSFAIKVGQAVASAAVSFLLAATGYVANTQQTPAALMGILASRSLVPALFAIVGVLCVGGWNLKKEVVIEEEKSYVQRI